MIRLTKMLRLIRLALVAFLAPMAMLTGAACTPSSAVDTTMDGRIYTYSHVDVFTDTPLTGNQLAVFLMPEGLSDDEMQLITREMNFSESTFVFAPEQEGTDFRVRIFGRTREMDFAGHPTIGTVEVLARAGLIAPGTERVVLGEGIGPIPVELEWTDNRLAFAWMHQLAPTFGKSVDDAAAVAAALGLTASDIVEGLPIQEVSCGNTFLIVPIATRAAVDRVVVDGAAMRRVLDAAGVPPRGLFLYSSESFPESSPDPSSGPGGDDATAYSRMLGLSGFEDPATGSASGPLGSYLVHHGVVSAADAGRIISRQGVAMGRPSRIHIDIGVDGTGTISRVRVGGETVHVGDGTIVLR